MSFHPPTPPSPRRNDSDSQAPKLLRRLNSLTSHAISDNYWNPEAIRPRLEGARPAPRPLPGSGSSIEGGPGRRTAVPADRRKRKLHARSVIPPLLGRTSGAQRAQSALESFDTFQTFRHSDLEEVATPVIDTPLEPYRDGLGLGDSATSYDATPLQTSDVLNDFDFDSFLNDNDNESQPFDLNGQLSDGDGNDVQPDDDKESTQSRKPDIPLRAFPPPKGPVREGISSRSRRNAPLLLHSTISEDYSNKEKVRRKLYCAMDKTFAPHPFKEGIDRTQFMLANKAAGLG